jgi:formate hydrogenlyase transcriptional activator
LDRFLENAAPITRSGLRPVGGRIFTYRNERGHRVTTSDNGLLGSVRRLAPLDDYERMPLPHDPSPLEPGDRPDRLRRTIGETHVREGLRSERTFTGEPGGLREPLEEVVGKSAALRAVFAQVDQVAATDSPVLLLGETGTGKELIARQIHERSRRRHRRLVTVNCSALPGGLVESELFGYEKGAFTGALKTTLGRFELADGGTILLDEIGELPVETQPKLLRVLQSGEVHRLGGARASRVDTRIIAATNRDLGREVAEGRYRADLFYRLSVFPITLPPLRERADDIPLLVWHFIESKQAPLGKTITRVSDDFMRALTSYSWPGNVRELENVIERALIMTEGGTLTADWLGVAGAAVPPPQSTASTLEEVERRHIHAVLASCGWKVAGKGNAAERLGLRRSTLQFRMRKLGINRPGRS